MSTQHHQAHQHLFRPFGEDAFGAFAERIARFFGTAKYIVGQTIIVIVWVALNALGIVYRWDPYPFILLNLAFSLQAAYAAPLILLAQTRQAERDQQRESADVAHRESLNSRLQELIEVNNRLTEEIHRVTVAKP